jgi:hydrogenase expression/formation protein HypE
MTSVRFDGAACPVPVTDQERVQLGHGSGGKLSSALLRERFLPRFANEYLARLGDGAIVPVGGRELVVSTDTFVVSPLEFPGGNIGALAVNGTLNDVAMMGAAPLYLTAGFVLEEGLAFETLDRILETMAGAAERAGVALVTGDTKVVERGKADGLYINTTGLGLLDGEFRPGPDRARPGDRILLSGPIGRHGMAIMAVREGLAFETTIESDTADLSPLVARLREGPADQVAALRDPTRGGLASALNEIAQASSVGMVLEERALPVPTDVAAACELLGLDPMYVANEGVLVAIVRPEAAEAALASLRSHPLGRDARIIGRVVADHPRYVVTSTAVGGTRVVDMLPGDQLPRIC